MKESMKGLPFLAFFFSLFSVFSDISIAADTITRNQSIADSQTLVSANETFELGFFSPGNSKNRYLGIWYKNPPTKTVVWVANRNNPLTNSTGILRIGKEGDLILLNETDSVIWSTNSSGAAGDPIVQLLDSGNLVLRESNSGSSENYLWQSFDFPSDTLLPGMKLGWDLKTGLDRYLTSWKNNDDPSNGDYSCGIENPELPQLVIRRGLMKENRFGPWNGVQFSGGPEMAPLPIFIPSFVYNTDEVYYTNERASNSVVERAALNYSGLLEFSYWKYQSNDWATILTLQQEHCDTYNLCGANGVCDISSLPICTCLKGFTPNSQLEWAVLNFSSGCIREKQLDCGKGDKFKMFPGLQLPDTLSYWLNKSMSLKKCEAACLKNCSCMAYANSDIRDGGSGCILWFKDLIDMRQASIGGQDLYIRLAASELESNTWTTKKKRRLILLVVVLGLLLFGFIICCIIFTKKKKRKNRTGNIEHNPDRDPRDESREEDLGLPLYDLVTISTATDDFSFWSKIGEGGFGTVYKGVLATGQEIAVKRLSKDSGHGIEAFKNEVILIAKLQHRNLVRLLGCCIQGEERLLIYEYLPNKSLDYFIFDKTRSSILNWQKRFDIIVGIARGLLYLHRDSIFRIVHRDLKASNILLDCKMNPKISDFGMARIFGGDQTEANTRRVVGTYGYMSPEYAIDGLFSVKSDVFSFGVLVLEIVSGRRNRGFYQGEHDLNLLGHAWKLWNEDKALELVDAIMKGSFPVSEVLRCIQVGLLCLQKRTEDRPTMSSVLSMLDSEDATLPQPNQPGFYTGRSLVERESSSSKDQSSSGNGVTTTMIEGR